MPPRNSNRSADQAESADEVEVIAPSRQGVQFEELEDVEVHPLLKEHNPESYRELAERITNAQAMMQRQTDNRVYRPWIPKEYRTTKSGTSKRQSEVLKTDKHIKRVVRAVLAGNALPAEKDGQRVLAILQQVLAQEMRAWIEVGEERVRLKKEGVQLEKEAQEQAKKDAEWDREIEGKMEACKLAVEEALGYSI